MKKLFLVGAVALFGATSLNAQQFGIKAGMNMTNVSNSDQIGTALSGADAKGKIGFHAGLFMNAPIAEGFSIQPELLYNSKGVKFTYSGQDANWHLDYLSVPVMFQYNATPQFYLEAGPELSLLLSSKMKGQGSTVDLKDNTNGFDFGLGLGAGYYFTSNVGLTARYVAGFNDIVKDNDGDALKNSAFQLGLAYKF